MKFGRTLAQTAFNIAMIVFVALIVFIFNSTAVARTPSLAVPQPMQIEVVEKTPSVDMGFCTSWSSSSPRTMTRRPAIPTR